MKKFKIIAIKNEIFKRLGVFKYPSIIKDVRKKGYSYLGGGALFELYTQMKAVEKKNIPGIVVEAGCALGGSAIVIATAKKPSRAFKIYDTFGMIPPPGNMDGDDTHERYGEILSGKSNGIGGDTYYGYRKDLLSEVKINFKESGLPIKENHIIFIKGLFEETLLINEPVAFAHIDGDWYQSVMTCLEIIVPNLSIGGILVIDDYYCWSGCKKAVDDYFADKKDKFRFTTKERLHIELRH
jgi:asparagine synthase (glutamine-hydrolysing)